MSKTRLPYMPFFFSDFLGSTTGWTLLERGVYFMLLGSQWERGALPNDMDRLAAMAGTTPDELAIAWPIVGPKFVETPAGLQNARLEQHRARSLQVHETRAKHGREGAEKRWSKRRDQLGTTRNQAAQDALEAETTPYAQPEFHEQVVAAYNEICTALAPIKNWPEHRARALNALIASTLKGARPMNHIDNWRWYFGGVARTRFLTGRGENGWRADIDWLLKPDHYFKIIEGGYEPQERKSERRADLPHIRLDGTKVIDGL